MKILKTIFFNPRFASQFLKPAGLIGIFISQVMKDNNFFVYPSIEQYADFQSNNKILEIGFGPGLGIKYYLDKYEITIDGIDFSKLMVNETRKSNSKFIKNGQLKLFYNDFIDHAFTEFYDRIIFANTIYFWKDLLLVFNKIHSLLTENGKLIFYMSNKQLLDKNKVANNPLFIKYTVEFVYEILQKSKFINIKINSIINPNYEYLIVSAER
jgi:SAM-dependent methyltransferase